MGFAIGCGSAQFPRGAMYSMGDLGSALLLSIAIFMWVREDAWRAFHKVAQSLTIGALADTKTLPFMPQFDE